MREYQIVVSGIQSITESDLEATLDWVVRKGITRGTQCKLRTEL